MKADRIREPLGIGYCPKAIIIFLKIIILREIHIFDSCIDILQVYILIYTLWRVVSRRLLSELVKMRVKSLLEK